MVRAGINRNGAVMQSFTREWIEQRLATRRQVPKHHELSVDLSRQPGDHSLNEGLSPLLPLKPAAVLVPLVERGETTVLFTRRTAHLAHHAGQISFPGGHTEPHDACPKATALRETEEEIGLPRQHVEVIGHLDVYVTRTGFVVIPVVGMLTPPFDLEPDPHEVAEVFEVPLQFLMDGCNYHRCSATFEGVIRHFHAIPYGDYYIWGATAGMLKNFRNILMGA